MLVTTARASRATAVAVSMTADRARSTAEGVDAVRRSDSISVIYCDSLT